MFKVLSTLVVIMVVTIVWAVPSVAQTVMPGGGNSFGQHVSSMAPEHPRDHGKMFGGCVSAVALTGGCSHHV